MRTPDICQKTEEAILKALVEELSIAGFTYVNVWDGEEYRPVSEGYAQLLEEVFAVSDSTVHFAPEDNPEKWGNLGVLLVCGNGEDFISDWHCGNKDFDAALDRVMKRIDNLSLTVNV
jgi:hypothetical protein